MLIPQAVRALIDQVGGLGWVGTVDHYGMPNISPRFILEVGPDYVVWANAFSNKTAFNLGQKSEATIGIAEYAFRTGYELRGQVELVEAGPLYEAAVANSVAKGFPRAKKVVKLTVESVRDLK